MKIFLSHSSMNKSNVKAIIQYLPKQIQTWLDEKNLVWGANLDETFESVIKTEIDYVIVFLGNGRDNHTWILKELNWALEHQKGLKRHFVLPVIMPDIIGDPFAIFPEISGLKYIRLDNYEENGFKSCAEKINQHLFSLILDDLDRMQKPKTVQVTQTISAGSEMLETIRNKIFQVAFPHRESNPITIHELYEKVNISLPTAVTESEFEQLVEKATRMIGGIYYDGYQLYIIEEHAQWKQKFSFENKTAIAHVASRHIKNGQTIFIDAGSTTTELINIICKRIESHNLASVKLIVISTDHANKISDICAQLGYDGYTVPVKLYIVGGVVRPNTKAIVGFDKEHEIDRLIQAVGDIDIAFVGANGATLENGITTIDTDEKYIKKSIISYSKKVYMLFDDSKCGIHLDIHLANFDDEKVSVIINENKNNEELNRIIETYPNKIELARRI